MGILAQALDLQSVVLSSAPSFSCDLVYSNERSFKRKLQHLTPGGRSYEDTMSRMSLSGLAALMPKRAFLTEEHLLPALLLL